MGCVWMDGGGGKKNMAQPLRQSHPACLPVICLPLDAIPPSPPPTPHSHPLLPMQPPASSASLLDLCCAMLCATLRAESACQVLGVADALGPDLDLLREAALEWVAQHFAQVGGCWLHGLVMAVGAWMGGWRFFAACM